MSKNTDQALAVFLRALADLNTAIDLDKNYEETYSARGSVYLQTGMPQLAVADFRKACALGYPSGCEMVRSFGP